MFVRTTTVDRLLSLKQRKKVIQGGTWAGKTYGIMAVLINHCIVEPMRNVTVVAETIPALKKGALTDFKQIMYETKRWKQDRYNGTDRIYTFENGSLIEFNSFDSVGKAQAAGKRTDLFLNEAYYIPFEIADALMGRTSGDIWIDFNPVSEFWAHDEILPQPGVDFIICLPGDNQALPATIKEDHDIKREKAKTSEYWANWCRVYLEGQVGELQGVVLGNWVQTDRMPEYPKWEVWGLDFGYSNDPTAIVRMAMFGGDIYLDEMLYQTGMTNDEIAAFIKEKGIGTVIADSAEPKSIEEIYRKGVDIRGAEKGRDSINFGISLLQQYNMFVTNQSTSLIKELRNYVWDKDKAGKVLNKPIDKFNHLIDAMRYAAMYKLKQQRTARMITKRKK